VLFEDVEKDVPWARIALQQEPEAINLWIGNSHSKTALHKDNYENIYVQVLGYKHFVLLPPIAYPCVDEKILPPATYFRTPTGDLEMRKDDEVGGDGEGVPFATWDPDGFIFGSEVKREDGQIYGRGSNESYAELAKKLEVRVTLEPGDMLYLPALWYHKVSQSCGEEGICVAVNYW
jgi:jumonji domain-containing protein 7